MRRNQRGAVKVGSGIRPRHRRGNGLVLVFLPITRRWRRRIDMDRPIASFVIRNFTGLPDTRENHCRNRLTSERSGDRLMVTGPASTRGEHSFHVRGVGTLSGVVLHLKSPYADTRASGLPRLYASRQAQEVDVRLLTLIRQLRLTHTFPDAGAAGVTAVSDAPAPAPSEEIRRLQLAMLERHVMATRLHRGARWNN